MPIHVFRSTNDMFEVGYILEAFDLASNDDTIVKIVVFDVEKDMRITYTRKPERPFGRFISWNYEEVALSTTN